MIYIYITEGPGVQKYDENNQLHGGNEGMATFANIDKRGYIIRDGKIDFLTETEKKAFPGLEGHKVKQKHGIAVTERNLRLTKNYDKYALALLLFHEIAAHIENHSSTYNEDLEHANYGSTVFPANGIYTDGSSDPNLIEGSLAWQIEEQILQLKIQEGNGTEQDKSDLAKMREADKERLKAPQHP
ncbi:MAG TPA: hypothetical protein VIM55_07845 [Mucilaginibacter sp.]